MSKHFAGQYGTGHTAVWNGTLDNVLSRVAAVNRMRYDVAVL